MFENYISYRYQILEYVIYNNDPLENEIPHNDHIVKPQTEITILIFVYNVIKYLI